MTTETTTAADPTVDLLFLGTRAVDVKKPQQVFEVVVDGKRTGQQAAFTPARKSAIRECLIGRLYRVPTQNEGRTYVFGSKVDLGLWPDEQDRVAIRATHAAQETLVASARTGAKAAEQDARMAACLAPLSAEYAKLRGSRARTAFELNVLYALRGF